VDKAESEPELAHLVNAEAPGLLARLAKELDAWLVHYSTDYVFDGRKDGPYTEDDAPAPLNVYGQSKLDGDLAIQNSGCRHLIFRTAWVFSADGRNFPKAILDLASKEDSLTVVDDQFGSPTSVELLSSATALALDQALRAGEGGGRFSGLYNLTSSGDVSWHGYAVYVVRRALELGWNLLTTPERVKPRSADETARPAKRPANSRLSTEKFHETFGLTPPPWQYYVDRVLWTWTRSHVPAAAPPRPILGRRLLPQMNVIPRQRD
jgi:dTDP-4-dehydrorhamnose reductase